MENLGQQCNESRITNDNDPETQILSLVDDLKNIVRISGYPSLHHCPIFYIIEQPRSFFRFSATREVNRGVGYPLYGSNSTQSTKSFVTVGLINAVLDNEYYISVTLYDGKSKRPILSPHILRLDGQSDLNPIVKKFVSKGETIIKYKLEQLYITQTCRRDEINIITQKYEQFLKWENNLITSPALNIDKIHKRLLSKSTNCFRQDSEYLKLCFELFQYHQSTNQYVAIADPIYTETFSSNEKFKMKLKDMKDHYVLIVHPDSIINLQLLTSRSVASNDICIIFSELYGNWSEHVYNFQKKGLNISCKVPNYDGGHHSREERQTVLEVKIKRISDKRETRKLKFIYEQKNLYNNNLLKQKYEWSRKYIELKPGEMICSTEICSKNFTIDLSKKIDMILKIVEDKSLVDDDILKEISNLNRDFIRNNKTLYGIFYASIDCDKLMLFCNCPSPLMGKILKHFKNKYHETLLHYVCLLDKSDYVQPLIERGCSIYAQDIERSTPLHIAIIKRYDKCINQFTRLYNSADSNSNFIDKKYLITLLYTYNNFGHTILHSAVLYDAIELVKAILLFAERNSLNVWDMDVMATGDTILHLAIRKKSSEMTQLILKIRPDACYYDNHSEILPPYAMNVLKYCKAMHSSQAP